MTRVFTRALAAAITAAVLAACSGGAGTGGVTPNASAAVHKTFAWHGALGKLKIRIAVPSKKEARRIAKLAARAAAKTSPSRRKPHYLPASATRVCFSLVAISGQSTRDDGLCDTPGSFDFALDTSDTSVCTAVGSGSSAGYSCAAIKSAPAAADSWTVVASDGATSNVLSAAYYTVTVSPQGETQPGFFTLNPVAAGLAWVSGTTADYGFDNGTGTPSYSAGAYTCPDPVNGGCYDPLLNGNPTVDGGGSATSDTAVLDVLDADGNVIVPTADTADGISGSPNIPIYLDSSGNELGIHVTCSDPDVEWVNGSGVLGGVPYTFDVLDGAGQPSTLLANGAHSATGSVVQFVGNGNADASSYPTFNSPVTGGYVANGGTDGHGNVIAGAIVGNDGAFVNYDGGGNGLAQYNLGTLVTCTAHLGESTSDGASAAYYIGLSEGAIGWGVDARHHRARRAR